MLIKGTTKRESSKRKESFNDTICKIARTMSEPTTGEPTTGEPTTLTELPVILAPIVEAPVMDASSVENKGMHILAAVASLAIVDETQYNYKGMAQKSSLRDLAKHICICKNIPDECALFTCMFIRKNKPHSYITCDIIKKLKLHYYKHNDLKGCTACRDWVRMGFIKNVNL